jgi:hypothetical protein
MKTIEELEAELNAVTRERDEARAEVEAMRKAIMNALPVFTESDEDECTWDECIEAAVQNLRELRRERNEAIDAARTDVPALIARVRELEAGLAIRQLAPVDPESERVVDNLLAKARENAATRRIEADVPALIARVRELEAECERNEQKGAEP